MTQTDPTVVRPTPADIRSWLADRVAYYLQEPAGEIDQERPLVEYGLDSVYAVALCGEIADVWGPSLDPAVIWDVDTIAKLSEHVSALLQEAPGAPDAPSAPAHVPTVPAVPGVPAVPNVPSGGADRGTR